MNRSIVSIMAIVGVLVGCSVGRLASVAAEEACHSGPPSPRQVYRQEKQTQIQQLTTQIQALQAQIKTTTDASTKVQLRAQIQTLDKQRCDLMIDIAQHQVQWDQEDIASAQERLTKAQNQLAKLQAREAEMEAKATKKL